MKRLFSYSIFILFLSACSAPKSHPDLFVVFGKLQSVAPTMCGDSELIFISEDGEKLHPNNLEDFLRKPEENKEFQLTYQEVAFQAHDSCIIAKPILINHIEPAKIK